MVYIKSIAAGIVAVVLAMIVVVFFVIVRLAVYKSKEGEALGWDIVAFAKTGLAWIVVGFTFVAGFIWELRRAR